MSIILLLEILFIGDIVLHHAKSIEPYVPLFIKEGVKVLIRIPMKGQHGNKISGKGIVIALLPDEKGRKTCQHM